MKLLRIKYAGFGSYNLCWLCNIVKDLSDGFSAIPIIVDTKIYIVNQMPGLNSICKSNSRGYEETKHPYICIVPSYKLIRCAIEWCDQASTTAPDSQ